jgi:DNA-binding NtrC family response regulator
LNKAIEEEKFIEDLFWRLNVITIEIPPLRERREDIDLLANHFMDEFSEKNGKKHTFKQQTQGQGICAG